MVSFYGQFLENSLMMRTLLILSYIAATLLVCSHASPLTTPWYEESPMLPPYFSASWVMYNIHRTDVSPPFADQPPLPYSAGRGKTYYSPEEGSIIEIYQDFCIPIFVNGSDWKCNFINTEGAAYLVSLTKSPYPSCCVFGKPWAPPHRNFTVNMKYTATSQLGDKPVDWWVMTCPDVACPFWYGFYRDTLPGGYRVPAAFTFPGWRSWATQVFYNVQVDTPPPHGTYDLPPQCTNAKDCGYL